MLNLINPRHTSRSTASSPCWWTFRAPNFAPHPATLELVEWLARHGGSDEIKQSAQRARTIYHYWLAANKGKVEEQMRLFDLEG